MTRRRVGKAYSYKAVTRSRSAFRTMLGELVDSFCGGSVQALVMNIIKAEQLSEEELLEIKRLADESGRLVRQRGEAEMNASWIGFDAIAGPVDPPIGLVLAAKWTVILEMAWLAHGLLAGQNPRWRVALWRGAMIGVVLIPVSRWLLRS